jgi:hypothetical protein
MRRTRAVSARLAVVLAALAASFALGVASQRLGVREAHAQPAPAVAATFYVPGEGLVFRTLDGRPLARLARDSGGGVLELYDSRGEVTQRVSAGGSVIPTAAAMPPAPSPRELHPHPYTTDSDPFESTAAAPLGARPGPGF